MAQVAKVSSVTTYCNIQAQRGSQSRFLAKQRQEPHPLVPTAPQGLEVSRLGKDG